MTDSGLNKYLDEIGREQLLSDEQEARLSERIKNGDQRAVSRLVEANLRYVVKVATLYRGQGLELDDLISEGNMGLMAAATKFDGSRGTRFVTFAAPYIRRSIEEAIDRQNGNYRIETPTVGGQNRGSAMSIDAPLGGRSNMSLLSVLVNGESPEADVDVEFEAVSNAVESALGVLNERESVVVRRFFGLGCEHATMGEIAADMGLRRERVRQIRNRAVRRLKKYYRHKLKELRR